MCIHHLFTRWPDNCQFGQNLNFWTYRNHIARMLTGKGLYIKIKMKKKGEGWRERELAANVQVVFACFSVHSGKYPRRFQILQPCQLPVPLPASIFLFMELSGKKAENSWFLLSLFDGQYLSSFQFELLSSLRMCMVIGMHSFPRH